MKLEEIKEVLTLQNEMLSTYKDWRSGQALFNALYSLYPNVADKIRGSDYDPFYIDGRRDSCLTKLLEIE